VQRSAALSLVGTEGPNRPSDRGDGLFTSLPRGDPIEMENAVCEAITRLILDGEPEIIQLEALFALERQAQPVSELLLAQYIDGDGQIGSFEWKTWRSALRLSQSLFQANEYFLLHIRKTSDDNWTAHEPSVQVQLFAHRKVEFLLRFLRYKKRSSELWRQLHEMYRLARERDLPNGSDAIGEMEDKRRTMRKLEQQYLQILLLEAMNGGQFSPREGLWAHRWFARWSCGPGLQLAQVTGRAHFESKGFVVDLDSPDGFKRALVAGGKLLYFDSSPLSAMIDQEIALLRDGATVPREVTPAVRAGQLALLNKLSILFAPTPVNIARRAERKPVAVAVLAIAGFSNIVAELWKNGQVQNDGLLSAVIPGNEKSISSFGVPSFSPIFAAGGDAGPTSLSISNPFDTASQIWQVKDRSDSGCRMRAQIDNLNLVIPGSLIAVRDSETGPWIVSVVRWFRRLMVDYVEIGVEYLGREPRFVKMVANDDGDPAIAGAAERSSKCFAALYLPPSMKQPNMPIKTLLFPARDFRIGSDVTLLSSNATYTMRLSEPIQQQFEYVWTSFAVIDKAASPPSKAQ
jgi:hypothetical protein